MSEITLIETETGVINKQWCSRIAKENAKLRTELSEAKEEIHRLGEIIIRLGEIIIGHKQQLNEQNRSIEQARREGWEQGKREAYIAGYERGHDDTVECCYGWMIEEKADEYIAAMEYKEKAND